MEKHSIRKTDILFMGTEWNYHNSHHFMITLNDRKHNQPDFLPVTSDLQKLKEYITFKIISLS